MKKIPLIKEEIESTITIYHLGSENWSFEKIFEVDITEIKIKAKKFMLENGIDFQRREFDRSSIAGITSSKIYENGQSHLIIFFSNGQAVHLQFKTVESVFPDKNKKEDRSNFYLADEKISKGFRINHVTGNLILDHQSALNFSSSSGKIYERPEYVSLGNFLKEKIFLEFGKYLDKSYFLTVKEDKTTTRNTVATNLVIEFDDKCRIKNKQNTDMKPENMISISFINTQGNEIIREVKLKTIESENCPTRYIYDKDPKIFSRSEGERFDFKNRNSMAFYSTLETQVLYLPHMIQMITSRGIQVYLKLRPVDNLAASLFYQHYHPPYSKDQEETINFENSKKIFGNTKIGDKGSFYKDNKKDFAVKFFNHELSKFLADFGPLESAVTLLQLLSDKSGEYFIDQKEKINMEKKYKFKEFNFDDRETQLPKKIRHHFDEILNNPKHIEITKDEIKRPALTLWRELSNLYLFKTSQQQEKTENRMLNYSKLNSKMDEESKENYSKNVSYSLMELPSYSGVSGNSMKNKENNFFHISSGEVCPSLFIESSVLYMTRLLKPVKKQKLLIGKLKRFYKKNKGDSEMRVKPSILVRDLNIIIVKLEDLHEFLLESFKDSDYFDGGSGKGSTAHTSVLKNFRGFGMEEEGLSNLSFKKNNER